MDDTNDAIVQRMNSRQYAFNIFRNDRSDSFLAVRSSKRLLAACLAGDFYAMQTLSMSMQTENLKAALSSLST